MSRTKKTLIVLGILLVVFSIPGIYVTWQTYSLQQTIDSSVYVAENPPGFRTLRGVSHVHSRLGGHSSGSFEDLIAAAKSNELDFVIMNEHVSHEFDTAQKTLREWHGDTLFLGGNELSSRDGDRFLVTEGSKELGDLKAPTNKELVASSEEKGRLLIHAYPEKSSGDRIVGDGVEVFSLHTNAKRMNPVYFLYDAFWTFRLYPELTLARHFRRPNENLGKYDRETLKRELLLYAGTDAHSNIGLKLGDDADSEWIKIKFDEYSSVFRLVRNYVLLPEDVELTKSSLIESLKAGRSYVSFDVLGNGFGFDFCVEEGEESYPMGTRREFEVGQKLKITIPTAGRIVLLKNGKKVFEKKGETEVNFEPKAKGVYRVEVFRADLGAPFDKVPWIMSNPIYLR